MLWTPLPLCAVLIGANGLPVALEVEVPEGSGCPTAEALTALAAGLADASAHDPGAARRLEVRYERLPAGFAAEMRLLEGERELGRRRVESAADDCAAVGEAVALAISILGAEWPVPEPQPTPLPASDAEPAPAPPAPPSRLVATWRVGLHASTGDTPGPALALGGGLDLARAWWRTGLEWRADVPGLGSGSAGGGEVSVWRGLVLLSFGATWRRFGLTALGGGGALRSSGSGFAEDRSAWDQLVVAGLELGYDFPLGPDHALRLSAGALAPLGAVRLVVGGETVWEAWPAGPVLGLELVSW